MKSITAILVLSFITIITYGQNNPDAILGKWMALSGNCMVEVYRQNTEYKAKVLWFNEGKKPMNEWTDEKNHDPALRNRKVLGMEVLHGLRYDPNEKEWINGIIYDASSGKEWDSIVWLTDDNLLKVRGFWVFKFLSQTKTFKKV